MRTKIFFAFVNAIGLPAASALRFTKSILAAAMDAPVAVMETAGEGGAWGIALLAEYMVSKEDGETLDAYLNNKIFAGEKGETMNPDPADVEGFDKFIELYKAGLPIEAAAVKALKL